MPAPKQKPTTPVVYPEVDPDLYATVLAIYAQWTPQEFSDAIAQYRRQQDLARKRADIELDLACLKSQLDDL